MLLMFGSALRRAPFERAFPFNNKDLMILANEKYGLRLCNICDETGQTFSIIDFMLDKPDIFGKDVENRIKNFVDIFPGRVERFFKTKKSDYIFFDLEEQKFLRKLMTKTGLSCSVEIYIYNKDHPASIIELEDIPVQDIHGILRFLSFCNVRAVMSADKYYFMANKKERQSYNFKKYKEDKIKEYFDKYPKLSSLDSKERVDKYFKLLLKKYHPDNNMDDIEACELFKEISEDQEGIKNTPWYKNLKEEGSK